MNNSNQIATQIKILITEDEVFILDFIEELLQEAGYHTLRKADNIADAELLIESFQPDLIILDINLNGNFEGIDLARKINSTTSIIFLTAQNDFSIIQKAIATRPENYLTKPIKKSDLIAAVQLVALKKKQEFFFIKNGYAEEKILFDEILYLAADKNYTDIILRNKKLTVRESLKNFLTRLPEHQFVQIHRSYIVNKLHVEKSTTTTVTINQTELPVSRSFRW